MQNSTEEVAEVAENTAEPVFPNYIGVTFMDSKNIFIVTKQYNTEDAIYVSNGTYIVNVLELAPIISIFSK
jgi:hypothetical protein